MSVLSTCYGRQNANFASLSNLKTKQMRKQLLLTTMLSVAMVAGFTAIPVPVSASVTQAKTMKVSGTVVDETNEPLIGASVMVKGTKGGVVTDLDGNFTIEAGSNAVLVISYVGYDDREFAVRGRAALGQIQLSANNNAQAKAIAAWKEHVAAKWDAIKVVTFEANHGPNAEVITSGSKHTLRVKVDTAGLEDSIGIEMVMTAIDSEGKEYVYEVSPFNIVDHEGNLTVYELVDTIDKAGSFKVAYRIYPKNDLLPHRQDFCYVKWF